MLVSLLTLGCPEQLSGGYLYHCRLAELAGDHDAEVEFVPVRLASDELWRAAEALRCRDGATPRQHSSRPSRS